MKRTKWSWSLFLAAALAMPGAALADDEHGHEVQPNPAKTPAQPAQPAQPVPSEDSPKLELSQREWNFGELWQGEPATVEVSVKNVGKSPLTIEVRSSCGCTVPTKPKSPLGPGESDKLRVSYDTNKRKGAANQTITIITNDPTQASVPFPVRGTVKALFDQTPADGLIFSQIMSGAEESKTLVIENKFTEKMFLKLKDGQQFGPFAVELNEKDPGMKYELKATTKPPLKDGPARAEIVLLTGVERIPEIKVPVYALVMPPVSVQPNRLFLPKNSSGPIIRAIQVRCNADTGITKVEAKASAESIKVEVLDRKGDAQRPQLFIYEVRITLPPGSELPTTGSSVTITTDASDEKYRKFEIPIQVIEPRPPTPVPTAAGPSILSPSREPAAQPKDKEEPKKDESKDGEPKKDEPKKDEPKKDEPKKDEPKSEHP